MPNPQSPVAKNPDSQADTQANTHAKKTPLDNPIKEKLKKSAKLKSTKADSTVSGKITPSYPTEFMATEYKGVSIYAMAMAILIGLILWTGIAIVQQVQAYHQQYSTLQQLKKDYRQLQIENQRLLIEQQTFSATPQIASRAVAELNMFYPQLSDRMIIQANNIATKPIALPNTSALATEATTASSTFATPKPATPIENGHVMSVHPEVEDPSEPILLSPNAKSGQGVKP